MRNALLVCSLHCSYILSHSSLFVNKYFEKSLEKKGKICYNNVRKTLQEVLIMNFIFDYHKLLSALHVGCTAPRAYYVPYASEKSALRDVRAESENFLSLCGDWDFKFYENAS